MTDSEKLDLLLSKMVSVDNKVDALDSKVDALDSRVDALEHRMTSLEKDVSGMKSDLHQLHSDDMLILDEVERVHEILERHINNRAVHTA